MNSDNLDLTPGATISPTLKTKQSSSPQPPQPDVPSYRVLAPTPEIQPKLMTPMLQVGLISVFLSIVFTGLILLSFIAPGDLGVGTGWLLLGVAPFALFSALFSLCIFLMNVSNRYFRKPLAAEISPEASTNPKHKALITPAFITTVTVLIVSSLLFGANYLIQNLQLHAVIMSVVPLTLILSIYVLVYLIFAHYWHRFRGDLTKAITIQPRTYTVEYSDRSYRNALLLSVFCGCLALDRFYLGYNTTAVIKIVTLGGAGFWYLYDIYLLLTGDLPDAEGRPLDSR